MLRALSRRTGAAVATMGARRQYVRPAYELAKKVMPKISDTEAAALSSGTISFDRDLFSGDLSLKKLTDTYDVSLTPEEQSFLENETEILCEMLDQHQIEIDQNLPPDVWKFIREKKFMGMVMPKKFGGLGFSGHGHAVVIEKIGGRSTTAGTTVAVPNSLGPGELLYHYGTPEQQQFYLPRLAHGIDIPCFGLTGPASGSDAAAMRDEGIVVEENGVLGMRVTFSKRYITLAPVATVIGLAFKLKDPNGLLTTGKEGITVALLPTEPNPIVPQGIPGLRTGPRHNPLNVGFMNGTVQGENVFIPMSAVIGGEERCGFGWNMLMECLGEGRGISLPAGGVAASRLCTLAVGGYARVRKQFKVPIAEMEGVQEKLSNIGMITYQVAAAQSMFDAVLANGEKPPVLSAIMKHECTELGRKATNEGMDIIGGAGISRGKMNFLASVYINTPVCITVEGANALTRSLIIYGQGLTRSHPHLLHLIKAIQDGDQMPEFNQQLTNIITHALTNLGRSVTRGLSVQVVPKGNDISGYYEAQLSRLTANFAFCADVGLTMGGGIKTAEFLSGRYADVLSNLYMGYACLWYYQKNKHVKGLDKVLDMAMADHCYKIQEAILGITSNFPVPLMGPVMRAFTFPRGREYAQANDKLRRQVSQAITTPTEVRALLTQNVFVSKDEKDRVNQISRAVAIACEADGYLAACRRAKRQPTPEEKKVIDEAEALREEIIQVDSFETLAGQNHREDWMKATWSVGPIDASKQSAAQ